MPLGLFWEAPLTHSELVDLCTSVSSTHENKMMLAEDHRAVGNSLKENKECLHTLKTFEGGRIFGLNIFFNVCVWGGIGGSTRVGTQGLAFAKQTFYHLSYTPSPA